MTHTRCTGFTLIELMIAITLIAILVGIALPTYASAKAAVRTQELRTALLSALNEARAAAVIHGTDTILCPSGVLRPNSLRPQGFVCRVR